MIPVTTEKRPLVMGILNVTPDSFSDGGAYADPGAAVERAAEMAADGDVVAVAEVTTDDAVADLAPEAAAEATELPADQ